MRRLALLALVTALMAGCGDKTKRLSPAEMDHYTALKVWMEDDQVKQYLKLKTEDERDAWLKERKLWDRFYQYEPDIREAILAGDIQEGWTYDQVYMSWGRPHDKKRLTGRPAQRSELLVYKFEKHYDGSVLVWAPGSKTAHVAQALFRVELNIDDGVVTEIHQKEGWSSNQ